MIFILVSYYDAEKAEYVIGKYKGAENAYVDNVKLCGVLYSHDHPRACITFRIPVSTIIYISSFFK
jgi:hypothetical protein